jgi:hypothetical protein
MFYIIYNFDRVTLGRSDFITANVGTADRYLFERMFDEAFVT